MSELYLTLRSRLPRVAEWVTLGQGVMRQARETSGLSREAVARQIPVSAKTYERWENAGRVPAQSVERIAEIIGLVIEREPRTTTVTLPSERETLARLEEIVADQMEIVRTIPGHLEGVTDALQEATETLGDVVRRLSALEIQQQRPAAPARRQRKSRP
jgi:transcriptional regulator with XRE-family HTH domain